MISALVLSAALRSAPRTVPPRGDGAPAPCAWDVRFAFWHCRRQAPVRVDPNSHGPTRSIQVRSVGGR